MLIPKYYFRALPSISLQKNPSRLNDTVERKMLNIIIITLNVKFLRKRGVYYIE